MSKYVQPPLIAQILDVYEVTPDKFAQIKVTLFAHVDKALGPVHTEKKIRLFLELFSNTRI